MSKKAQYTEGPLAKACICSLMGARFTRARTGMLGHSYSLPINLQNSQECYLHFFALSTWGQNVTIWMSTNALLLGMIKLPAQRGYIIMCSFQIHLVYHTFILHICSMCYRLLTYYLYSPYLMNSAYVSQATYLLIIYT